MESVSPFEFEELALFLFLVSFSNNKGENNNGRIQPFIDEETNEFIGPQRVWIKEDDVPGLAMTRSFGDQVAAMVGVMSEPDFFRFFRAVFAYLRTNFLFSEEYRRFLQHKRPFFEIS